MNFMIAIKATQNNSHRCLLKRWIETMITILGTLLNWHFSRKYLEFCIIFDAVARIEDEYYPNRSKINFVCFLCKKDNGKSLNLHQRIVDFFFLFFEKSGLRRRRCSSPDHRESHRQHGQMPTNLGELIWRNLVSFTWYNTNPKD